MGQYRRTLCSGSCASLRLKRLYSNHQLFDASAVACAVASGGSLHEWR